MRPQVASEGVPPAAGVVAEVAFERLLPGMQLDVPEQVALLGEGGPALIALEGPFSSVASFVNHEHIGPDANDPTDITL